MYKDAKLTFYKNEWHEAYLLGVGIRMDYDHLRRLYHYTRIFITFGKYEFGILWRKDLGE